MFEVDLLPFVNVLGNYNFGAPCQPWSSEGANKGLDDERGQVIGKRIKDLKVLMPKTFFMEMVEGMLTRHGDVFQNFLRTLQDIRDESGHRVYKIRYKVLDSMDFHLPRRRRRIYLVGWKRAQEVRQFKWP